ncbi:S4 domain-containing protein [Rhodococcus zopfii]|uniref:S4 domain-containing protein n=1 Tax=Rhodococcus sp. HM1 TaxID=2937759 RepID=UPI00200AB143|nr:S4 domain-containing protein [Rhodococcus sp. HM1]MCK8671193.1 S4 domain-containing protein [Rhodococcus sp. HM1]
MPTLVPDSLFGFLQDSGLAGSAGEAAALLMEGLVRINDLPARNPRVHLVPGDVVSVAGAPRRAVFAPPAEVRCTQPLRSRRNRARLVRVTGHPLPKTSAPAQRALDGIGVATLEDLTRYTERDLLALHGMGPKAVRILREDLERHGLSFA